jgi:pimeloyl-ACP methyl ester carboxylesterase
MHDWIPHTRLVLFSVCGHAPNLEEPGLFNLHVAEFPTAVEGVRYAGWSR